MSCDCHMTTCVPVQEADTEGSDQKLDFEEFCGLFKELATRPEVSWYCSTLTYHMTVM